MKILSFNTSSNIISVSISEFNKILFFIEESKPFLHSEKLITMIETALNTLNIDYDNISFLGVIKGPGSFTGIRAGLAAAIGIILAKKNIKIIAITNFDLIHFKTITQIDNYNKVTVLLSSYKEDTVYKQSFNKNWTTTNPEVANTDDIFKLIKNDETDTIYSYNMLLKIDNKLNSNKKIITFQKPIDSNDICEYVSYVIQRKNLYHAYEATPLYL